MIHEQEVMPRMKWIKYVEQQRDSACVCDPESRSCTAHRDKATGGLQYWCPVKKTFKDQCTRSYKPRIDDLKKMPGTKDDRLWTKKLCSGADMCQCEVGMGVRVWGEQIKNLNPKLQRAIQAEGKSDAIIGYKCDRWYEADHTPWCVVGFDSPCADRVPMPISPVKHLRMYTSRIPCQRERLIEIIGESRETCLGLRCLYVVMDILRYLMTIPMWCVAYQFLMKRCADGGSEVAVTGFKAEQDEEIEDWLSTDSAYSSYSDSESSVFTDDESKAKSVGSGKSKDKAAPKGKAAKASGAGSDSGGSGKESSKGSGSKTKKKKKQSEWSD